MSVVANGDMLANFLYVLKLLKALQPSKTVQQVLEYENAVQSASGTDCEAHSAQVQAMLGSKAVGKQPQQPGGTPDNGEKEGAHQGQV